ncbi:MAG TPA: ATP-dependent 6-phosphofructokinase [Elusimicrobiota bacterium]|nr:ATP-dependent 6-phosphofructokinase [Elusimicrobiota bacterium]
MFDPKKIKRIAINTGGGDAPGLNAVIRAATLTAIHHGWEVFGVRHGYRGLEDPKELVPLTAESVRGITHLGGTILGTANRGNPFESVVKTPEGEKTVDISDQVVENFHKQRLDALICVGGDGSLRIASKFADKGIPLVGVPKTIDNDLSGTVATFGFDTAVSTATDAIDKLHSTAEAHERVMVVELMGRYAGHIALHSGVSGTADVILIPEIPFDLDKVCDKVLARERMGRHFTIIVCAEGAHPKGVEMMTKGPKQAGREILLGGIAQYVAQEVGKRTGKETRSLVLGHLQRGGGPTTFDRLLGLRFGAAAVRCLAEGKINVMVALDPPRIKTIPIAEAVKTMKAVDLNGDTMLTAREMGISFGD